MNTVDAVATKLAAGKRAASLWVDADRHVELRFEDGEVMILPGTAVGSRKFNEGLNGDYRTAISTLAKIIEKIGWEDDSEDAYEFLSEFVLTPGRETRVYPF